MINALKPYSQMKDSGVAWLGDVPEHWDVELLGRSIRVISGDMISSDDERESGIPIYGGNGIRGYTFKTNSHGPIVLLGRVGAMCGCVHLVNGPLWASEHTLRVIPQTEVDLKFLALVLEHANLNRMAIRTAQPLINSTIVRSHRVAVPPISEQAAIVRFLDHADRRIRRYIRAKQKLIELLEEYKQAIIHRAVTGQIDVRTGQPYPRYKPSGVAWLGEVPEHWEVASLRHRYSQVLGKMLDSKRITGQSLLPYLRNTDVQWDRINIDGLPQMDIAPAEYERYTVRVGDLLVCEGGEVGRAAIWTGSLPLCGFQKALHRLRPLNPGRDVPRFLYYGLRAAAKGNAFSDGHVSTISHLTGEKLRGHPFPFPPKDEQQAIANWLDTRLFSIVNATECAARQVDLLREYRTRLIADVVTGKLDVRVAAASLPEETEEPEPLDEAEVAGDAEESDAGDGVPEEVGT